jgi:hypothetical protein
MIEENVNYSEMDSQEVTYGIALFIQTLGVTLNKHKILFIIFILPERLKLKTFLKWYFLL